MTVFVLGQTNAVAEFTLNQKPVSCQTPWLMPTLLHPLTPYEEYEPQNQHLLLLR